jgi:hypothetical protein
VVFEIYCRSFLWNISYSKYLKISLFEAFHPASLTESMSSIVPRHFPANAPHAGRGNDVGIGGNLVTAGFGAASANFSANAIAEFPLPKVHETKWNSIRSKFR